MNKVRTILIITALVSTSSVFADDMVPDNQSCDAIAQACTTAGYSRDSQDKPFWKACMKPLLLGQTVSDVTINPSDVKTCRAKKIDEMKKEIVELQNAMKKK